MSESVVPLAAANSADISVPRNRFAKGNMFRFPVGRSGNPAGRPRQPLTEALRVDLERRIPNTPDLHALCEKLHLRRSSTWAQLIARSLVWRAIESTEAAQEVTDRTEGKSTSRVEVGGPYGNPIKFVVEYIEGEDKP